MSQHPVYCPAWEYTDVAGHEKIIMARTRFAIIQMAQWNRSRKVEILRDTRSFHRAYFQSLTPLGFEYYAGNYRGSDFECLKHHSVMIRNDPRVGHPPGMVEHNMKLFVSKISTAFADVDLCQSTNSVLISDEDKLFRTIEVAAALFVYFLEIHPYVNGNGHMGRLILLCFLSVYGIVPVQFPLHPRPADPPYSSLIAAHRSGNDRPLIHFILSCL